MHHTDREAGSSSLLNDYDEPEILLSQLHQSVSIKISAKQVVSHGRDVAFQMAEVAIPKSMFADILRMIAELLSPPLASAT